MLTRRIKIQLMLFALIAVVGIAYTGVSYVGLDRYFGGGGYRVTAELADSGGIFTNAEVTYRGVAVGQVTALRLSPDGVTAELNIEHSAPPIPADTRAVVADRSAIGEQTVDLRPEHDTGPFLRAGSVIPREHTALPPRPSDVLTNVDQLVSSVPTDSLRTVVAELGAGFANTGPAMRQLIDGAGAFIKTANEHLPQTVALANNAQTVLRTQRQQSGDIRTFSRGLQQIAAQLKKSDPDLRTVITDSSETADQVQWVVREVGPPLADVVSNSLELTRVAEPRSAALKQLFVSLPMVTMIGPTLAPDGRGHLGLVLNIYDPPPCEKGYEGTDKRRADDLSPGKPLKKVHCAEPKGSPTNVRGSQNAPTPGH
ncbi:MCE family protein [Pseudonocardia spinosispora]|uniref:MCE family protein n=1 Tax=Pseudonocardia spinosispora TaxID=103441 RepID=UPI00040E4116|nr:MlaD family protein [Pseudonocardia spinosispora]